MTELFRTILIRVTLAGVVSAAALRVVGSGALREVVKLAAGLLMLLALLQPLRSLPVGTWGRWNERSVRSDITAIEEKNAQMAMSTLAASVAEIVEARAEKEGFHCTVKVEMATDEAGILQIERVTVHYSSQDAARLGELRALLTEECGVPEQRQELIQK